ncbi:MAG: molybdate transporter family protein, partial [candidate division Zixibacteria bacterium]
IVLLLAISGLIDVVNRIIPKPVIRGLQLAIGIKLLFAGIAMISNAGYQFAPDSVFTAIMLFVLVLISFRYGKIPGALLLFLVGIILVYVGNPVAFRDLGIGWQTPFIHFPSPGNFLNGFWRGTIPQIPLTILNSVIAVCALSTDLFPEKPLVPKKVAISVGLMNLIACPLGGMPMCHGAGGLAAQYRFGARTGGSVVLLGLAKIIFAVTFGGSLLAIISLYPASVLGVMLLFAGWQMIAVCVDMKTKLNIIPMALTAVACLTVGTAVGFIVGFVFNLILYKMIGLEKRKRENNTRN